MTVIHHSSKSDYLNSLNKKNIQTPELAKPELPNPSDNKMPEIGTKPVNKADTPHTVKSALDSAKGVAKSLISSPPLPIGIPTGASLKPEALELKSKNTETKEIKNTENKKTKKLEKPALIFIEGFELFSSGGNGIEDMAKALPGGKHFTWDQKTEILKEIQKHSEKQPVALIGHSFGADTAVEIAEELNNLQNGYRPIDLLITLDAVGFNHHVIPVNVKRNLNFFAEGRIPMLHGTAHVAKNPKLTEVHNELKSETHTKIDDSQDIQFEIFNELKNIVSTQILDKNSPLEIPVTVTDDVTKMIESEDELVLEVQPTINIFVLGDSPNEN